MTILQAVQGVRGSALALIPITSTASIKQKDHVGIKKPAGVPLQPGHDVVPPENSSTALERSTFVSEVSVDVRQPFGQSNAGQRENFGAIQYIVGDETGKLSLMSFDGSEAKSVWSTTLEGPVSSICLDHKAINDVSLLIAFNQAVCSYKTEGKRISLFETNLADRITSISKDQKYLYVTTEYLYNIFENGVDSGCYQSSEKIASVIVLKTKSYLGIVAVACEDNCIRLVQGGSVTLLEMSLPSKPSMICSTDAFQGMEILFCGTVKGEIVCIGLFEGTFKILWTINTFATGSLGRQEELGISLAITSLSSWSLPNSNRVDVIIGREDGMIQIYTIRGLNQPLETRPSLVHETDVDEPVSNALLGLSSTEKPFILASLRSGKIMFLTFRMGELEVPVALTLDTRADKTPRQSTYSLLPSKANIEEPSMLVGSLGKGKLPKIGGLPPVEAKKSLVSNHPTTYNAPHNSDAKMTVKSHHSEQSIPLTIRNNSSVKSRLYSMTAENCLALIVASDTGLTHLVLESNVPLSYQTTTSPDMNIMQSSDCGENEKKYLAVIKCDETLPQVTAKIFASEGMHGVLTVFAFSNTNGLTCSETQHTIKALCMHERAGAFSDEKRATCTNKLGIKCDNSIAELHSWLMNFFEGLPEKPPSSDVQEVRYYFENQPSDSTIICDLRKGSLTFETNSILTISHLRDSLKLIALDRKRKIDLSVKIDVQKMERHVPSFSDRVERIRGVVS
ncbi:hypothetical protein BC829DRAFT_488072 [Chytridium lagenaria]|nr:hypothetical protein BC829DRAFT_488072 [Chytridium lagenaria]